MKINVLCIGDVVGRPGRRIIADKLKPLVKKLGVDCVIVNAENAAGGSGLTPQIYTKLMRYGVNLVTFLQSNQWTKDRGLPPVDSRKEMSPMPRNMQRADAV